MQSEQSNKRSEANVHVSLGRKFALIINFNARESYFKKDDGLWSLCYRIMFLNLYKSLYQQILGAQASEMHITFYTPQFRADFMFATPESVLHLSLLSA